MLKATFFCIGDNVRKHPDVFEQVKKDGHAIGNHTFNHLKGWAR
jgi:peptidoglycan/xylan/chitin deacetylase (PgdA/CDA1 family)